MTSLSILIPAYNWDCELLVKSLQSQCDSLGIDYEIIVADDCSPDITKRETNRKAIEEIKNAIYIQLEKNIGRSAIRNLLADRSKYKKLLFLDCDSMTKDDKFIKRYIDISEDYSVICGGLIHPEKQPYPCVELRYRYEKRADKKRGARYRNTTPYSRFTPFSFLIDRDVFMEIRFPENFIGYGYEDVLFGLKLEEKNISIIHIDNPLIHIGLEENNIFLEKTRQSIHNLYNHKDDIGTGSTLLTQYKKLRSLHLAWIIGIIDSLFGKAIINNLQGNNPSLFLFSMYKLSIIHFLWR